MNEPYDFLASFTRAHESAGAEDPARAFDYWFTHGYVFKSPDHLLIGGEDPDEPSNDLWFVYWAEIHPRLAKNPSPALWLSSIAAFLKLMPYHRPRVKFHRGVRGRFDGRIYSTDRLLRLISDEHHSSTCR